MKTDELWFIVNKKTNELIAFAKTEDQAKEILWSWRNPEYMKISKTKVSFEDIGTYEWKYFLQVF